MITITQGLAAEHAETVARWTNERGADFLRQYAGRTLSFPLTAEQLSDRPGGDYAIFVDGSFAGMIFVMVREGGNAHVGRFILDPALRGRGLGSQAMEAFCRTLFADEALESISLNVFRFNTPARRCYEKCGFVETAVIQDGGDGSWDSLRLEKRRQVQ